MSVQVTYQLKDIYRNIENTPDEKGRKALHCFIDLSLNPQGFTETAQFDYAIEVLKNAKEKFTSLSSLLIQQ